MNGTPMSIDELIKKARETKLPGELARLVEAMNTATKALRPHYPPGDLYRLDFGQRVVLREAVDPQQHSTHWWHSGLHTIRQGIATQPQLEASFGSDIDALHGELSKLLGPYEEVTLREIDDTTVTGICLLSELMQYPQNSFVAPNAYSLAQALFHDTAWYRAVYAGKAPVGFVMLDDNAEKPEYYLWRFMIAPPFQRLGFGAKAIALLIDYVRTRPGANELLVSYIDHEEGPAAFYRGLGFVETGEIDEGEVVMRLDLQA